MSSGLRLLLRPAHAELTVTELSVLVALLRCGPLEPEDLAAILGGWFAGTMTPAEATAALKSIEARGWLSRRGRGWVPSAAAYAPTRKMYAGLARMLGEPDAVEADDRQLRLISTQNEKRAP